MKNLTILISVCFSALLGSSYVQADIGLRESVDDVFTLYRSSAIRSGDTWRLHVATFDAKDGKEYNQQNCEVAQKLLQNQSGVTVRYWCDKGYFKK